MPPLCAADSTGCVLMANEAAHGMLALQRGAFFPADIDPSGVARHSEVCRDRWSPRLSSSRDAIPGRRTMEEDLLAEIYAFPPTQLKVDRAPQPDPGHIGRSSQPEEETRPVHVLAGSRIAAASNWARRFTT